MSDELDNLTDAQLSEVFAVEVAGWTRHMRGIISNEFYWRDEDCSPLDCNGKKLSPSFSTDANAVLPFLEKHDTSVCWMGSFWIVNIGIEECSETVFYGKGTTFAKAACIALIRAKRSEGRAS